MVKVEKIELAQVFLKTSSALHTDELSKDVEGNMKTLTEHRSNQETSKTMRFYLTQDSMKSRL